VTVESGAPGYALQLSDAERTRYREMARRARDAEADRWHRYGIVPGARVADIGCGPGAVLVLLAELVAPGGSVVGVEPDAAARAAAAEEIRLAGVENATVVEGNGVATTLEAGAYDTVMIRHVLFHVGAKLAAVIDHAASLLRRGGHLYAVDSDVSGIRLSVDDTDVEEQIARYREFQRNRGNNVDVGPRLGPLIGGAGLEVLEQAGWFSAVPAPLLTLGGPIVAARSEMLGAGIITEHDARRYDEAMKRVTGVPHAVLFMPLFLAVGRKP
jgi:SAM-dependent methyltransferase